MSSRRSAWWLALLPLVPPLSVLGVISWRRVTALPLALRWLLGTAAVLLLLSSVAAARPLPGLVGGVLRVLVVGGLLLTGWQLARPGQEAAERLRPLLWGLLVVWLTALLNTALLEHGAVWRTRLLHPFLPMVWLGIMGGVGLWLAACWRGGVWWLRWPLLLLGFAVMVLSGSRSAVAAGVVGLLAAALVGRVSRNFRLTVLAGLVLLLAGAALLPRLSSTSAAAAHLSQLDLNSRDLYWDEARSIAQRLPWGGSGVLQLGALARTSEENCWQEYVSAALNCPPSVRALKDAAWFQPFRYAIWQAHNVALQSLAESGLVGTAGLFLLLGLVTVAALAGRDPFLIATAVGYAVINLVDNATLLVGMGVADLYWLIAGMALRSLWARPVATGWLWSRASLAGGVLLLASLVPVQLPQLLTPQGGTGVRLLTLSSARGPLSAGRSAVMVGLQVPAGQYRLQLRLCDPDCVVVDRREISSAGGAWWGELSQPPLHTASRLQLLVLPAANTFWSVRPLAQAAWTADPGARP
ncbi:O-antigen ligase family protein [Deinococcus sonorensis]|uniref:O-antigen ligase family protein n=2 Tax=Deinococcus sonorensis TaxID=309891 RepID=A0AAU7UD41_9DEIO